MIDIHFLSCGLNQICFLLLFFELSMLNLISKLLFKLFLQIIKEIFTVEVKWLIHLQAVFEAFTRTVNVQFGLQFPPLGQQDCVLGEAASLGKY